MHIRLCIHVCIKPSFFLCTHRLIERLVWKCMIELQDYLSQTEQHGFCVLVCRFNCWLSIPSLWSIRMTSCFFWRRVIGNLWCFNLLSYIKRNVDISMISPLSQSWWLNPNVWWLNKIKSINLCHFPGSRSLAQKKKSITPPSIAPASAAALQHAARALDFEATRGVAPGVVSTNKRWGSTWVNTQNGGFYQETYRKHIENI